MPLFPICILKSRAPITNFPHKKTLLGLKSDNSALVYKSVGSFSFSVGGISQFRHFALGATSRFRLFKYGEL